MAKEDASVAIQNALQKLEQQPSLFHNAEKIKSLKSDLHRVGSNLGKFTSVSKLTEVRELAYDVEDTMDDAIMVAAAAQKRWRKLGNSFKLLLLRADKINQQRLEEQIDAIGIRTASIERGSNNDEVVVENNAPPEEGLFKLFYLSLSGFPAEVGIPSRQLIQIWAADGILDQQRSTSVEEQGRDQINWLLSKGYIRETRRGTCGDLKTFEIEKERLDKCVSAALRANYLQRHLGQTAGTTSALNAVRLVIHNDSTTPSTGSNLRSFAHVRSLHVHNKVNNTPLDLKEFGSLRILDLGWLELETVPGVIGNLVHLRYLRLKAPRATRIPASICKLPNLQTIDLKETKHLKAMPVQIWNMKTRLWHLHLGDGATALPAPPRANHIDALTNLRTLCGVHPDKDLKRLMVRSKFPNVSRLRLQCTSKKDVSFLESLDLLYHLRSLTLRGPIEDLPLDWSAFPSSLTKMTLSNTGIPAHRCVATLENQPNLRYLKLMEDSVVGEEMNCAAGGFPTLQVLRMEGLKDLKSWKMEKGAMRFLRDLKVRRCESLKQVEAYQPWKVLRETLQTLRRNNSSLQVHVWVESLFR